jgi:hypothetical protein
MSSSWWLGAVALFVLSSFGCAATEEDSGGNETAVSSTSPRAKLTRKNTRATNGKCITSAEELEIGGIPTAAAASINTALLSSRTTAFANRDCSRRFEWVSAMNVTHFAQGYLSVETKGFWNEEEGARSKRFAFGHNFELATGRSIGITELLTTSGLKKAVRACEAGLKQTARQVEEDDGDAGADDDDESSNDFLARCSSAVREKEGPASFTFDEAGIRIHPRMAKNDASLEVDGSLVPWAAVEGGLTAAGLEILESTR